MFVDNWYLIQILDGFETVLKLGNVGLVSELIFKLVSHNLLDEYEGWSS